MRKRLKKRRLETFLKLRRTQIFEFQKMFHHHQHDRLTKTEINSKQKQTLSGSSPSESAKLCYHFFISNF